MNQLYWLFLTIFHVKNMLKNAYLRGNSLPPNFFSNILVFMVGLSIFPYRIQHENITTMQNLHFSLEYLSCVICQDFIQTLYKGNQSFTSQEKGKMVI